MSSRSSTARSAAGPSAWLEDWVTGPGTSGRRLALTVFAPSHADPGSAGLAGLLQMRSCGALGDSDRTAVLFTGIQRRGE